MADVIRLPLARTATPSWGGEEVDASGTPVESGTTSERVHRAARAVDECAAEAEDLIGVLRDIRRDLMGRRALDLPVALLGMTTRLAGIASVLGETNADLDEVANDTTGGDAA